MLQMLPCMVGYGDHMASKRCAHAAMQWSPSRLLCLHTSGGCIRDVPACPRSSTTASAAMLTLRWDLQAQPSQKRAQEEHDPSLAQDAKRHQVRAAVHCISHTYGHGCSGTAEAGGLAARASEPRGWTPNEPGRVPAPYKYQQLPQWDR